MTTETPPCADCGAAATCSLGTTWLCGACKKAIQETILARRPDLRTPIADRYGVCPECKATACRPLETCWWCRERERWHLIRAQELDVEQVTKLQERIAEGEGGLEAELGRALVRAIERDSITPTQALAAYRTMKKAADVDVPH